MLLLQKSRQSAGPLKSDVKNVFLRAGRAVLWYSSSNRIGQTKSLTRLVAVLLINAIAILSEDRFLARSTFDPIRRPPSLLVSSRTRISYINYLGHTYTDYEQLVGQHRQTPASLASAMTRA